MFFRPGGKTKHSTSNTRPFKMNGKNIFMRLVTGMAASSDCGQRNRPSAEPGCGSEWKGMPSANIVPAAKPVFIASARWQTGARKILEHISSNIRSRYWLVTKKGSLRAPRREWEDGR